MRTSKRLTGLAALLPLFALACGPLGENSFADGDSPEAGARADAADPTRFDGGTVDAGDVTADALAAPARHAEPPPPYTAESTVMGFSPTGRWAFFADEEVTRVTLVDTRDGTTRVLTTPLADDQGYTSGRLLRDEDLTEQPSRSLRFSPDEARVLTHAPEGAGVVVVNLETGEAEITLEGELTAFAFAPHGRWLAATEAGAHPAVHVVELGGREHLVLHAAGAVSGVAWQPDGTLAYSERTGERDASLHLVDLARPDAPWTIEGTDPENPSFERSPSGEYLSVATPDGGLGLVRRGERTPRVRIRGEIAGTRWHATHARFVWTERDGAEGPDADHTIFHVVDAATGAEVRFRGAGSCTIATEVLVSFEGDVLVTDGECSPGCPSIEPQSEEYTYDARTGAVTGPRMGTPGESYNGERDRLMDELRALATPQGEGARPAGAVLVLADDARAFIPRGDGVALVERTSGRVLARLEGSSRQSVEGLRVSYAGARVVGVDADGVARAWDAETGVLTWASR